MNDPNIQALSFLASADTAQRRGEIPRPMGVRNSSTGAGRLQRKLAAIFYADAAGYSRLTEEDEEGAHRTLSSYLDATTTSIEHHGGKVMHFAGDAVLADFGAAEDALACAVDIQRDLKRRNDGLPEEQKLQFRIGINWGDVIVDRNEIYGNEVNVAVRLRGLAQPGGICISEAVHDAIGTRLPLAFAFVGQQLVKNIVKPIRAFQVHLAPGGCPLTGETENQVATGADDGHLVS